MIEARTMRKHWGEEHLDRYMDRTICAKFWQMGLAQNACARYVEGPVSLLCSSITLNQSVKGKANEQTADISGERGKKTVVNSGREGGMGRY